MANEVNHWPSYEEQNERFMAANLEVMDWLEDRGTLVVAKNFFARWLFDAEDGTLELYSDRTSPQEVGMRLQDNKNYRLSVSRYPEHMTWHHIIFDSGAFTKYVVVGKTQAQGQASIEIPFYYRGFDSVDLGYVKEAATRLKVLRTAGVPDLVPDLYGVENIDLHTQTR